MLISICYGRNEVKYKEPLWDSLNYISNGINLPWIVLGDFNAIRWESEKMGGTKLCPKAMESFNNCIDYCGLTDLLLAGYQFTWSNSSEGAKRIECRLDRALVNQKFIQVAADYQGAV